jgi:soluble lytic murein transglycosylase-like protein
MRARAASRLPDRAGRLATAVLLALAATGCAGTRRAALREDLAAAPDVSAPGATIAPAERPAEPAAAPAAEPLQQPVEQQVSPEHVEAHVRAQVAQRMPGAATTTHRNVATTVLAESTRAGVDPLLVVALIHVESSFKPRARSRAGALGLMQVRVPTLREQLKRPKARRADALDPHTNVQAGVRYFRQLLDTFGTTDLALMAYNAGPGRIQRLLANGGIPPRIRDYARKVGDELERIRDALLRPRRAEGAPPSLGDLPALGAAALPGPGASPMPR